MVVIISTQLALRCMHLKPPSKEKKRWNDNSFKKLREILKKKEWTTKRNSGKYTSEDVSFLEKSSGLNSNEIKMAIKEIDRQNFNQKQIKKFDENFFLFVSYLFVFIFGSYVLYDQQWAHHGKELFFLDRPKHAPSRDLILYYFLEFGFYLQGLVTHVFVDRHLKDFWVMFTHHIATLGLIGYSYGWGYLRIGSAIMWIHDWCDPILNTAKLFHYCGYQTVSTTLFALLILSWIGTRLIFYLIHCVHAVVVVMPTVPNYDPTHYLAYTPSLVLLYILHWYWFYLMLIVIYRSWWKGEPMDDVRSDDERTSPQ